MRAVTDTLTRCVEFNAAHDIKNQAGVIGNIFVSLISYRDTTIRFVRAAVRAEIRVTVRVKVRAEVRAAV